MALSNMDKDVITRLMQMISCDDENNLSAIKADHACFGKLTLLTAQMSMLQQQAQEVVEQAKLNARLKQIVVTHTRVPGTIYHLYTHDHARESLSFVGPDEWNSYNDYCGAFLYDFDHSFKRVEAGVAGQ